jgi:hypothetical protein
MLSHKAGGHSLVIDNRVLEKAYGNRPSPELSTYFGRHMRKKKGTIDSRPIKHEVRTCCAFEGPFGRGRSVVQNKRFFFAWKDGCLMGTYATL